MDRRMEHRELMERQYRDDRNLQDRISLHDRFSTGRLNWHQWVLDQLRLGPGARILEVGCGPGTLWERGADRIRPDWLLLLTDLSSGMASRARLVMERLPARGGCLLVDAERIPLPAGSMDRIVANHMLYHVADAPAALAELSRVLHPEGVLYAATNGRAHLREMDEWIEAHGGPPGRDSTAERFGLETGRPLMEDRFQRVDLLRHRSDLEVTEVEPLLRYILSTPRGQAVPSEGTRSMEAELREQLRRDGMIRIAKDSGLLVAQEPR